MYTFYIYIYVYKYIYYKLLNKIEIDSVKSNNCVTCNFIAEINLSTRT